MNDSVTALKNKHLIYPSKQLMKYKLSIAIAKLEYRNFSFCSGSLEIGYSCSVYCSRQNPDR